MDGHALTMVMVESIYFQWNLLGWQRTLLAPLGPTQEERSGKGPDSEGDTGVSRVSLTSWSVTISLTSPQSAQQ